MEMVNSFGYLGNTLMEKDDHWPSVVVNLLKLRWTLEWLLQVLGKEGADMQTLGRF